MLKKLFSLFAAALMSASMFATPAAVPTVQDVSGAGFDVANARVIVLYFDEQVCNDIVWAGSYNGWSTSPDAMLTFEPLEGFQGWYAVEVFDKSETVQGKPVQLKKDGSFSWDFQSGDADAWINMFQPNTKTASIEAQPGGEADLTWPENGVYIYEVAYFKNHNTPCGADTPKHDYYIIAYLPEFCDAIADYADSVRVMGGFDDWSDGINMQKTTDEDFNDIWYATLADVEEGTTFKLRFGTDTDWAVQVRKDGKNLSNEVTGEATDIILYYDGEGYDFAACAAPAIGDQFEDATSGLKFEVTAVEGTKTAKVIPLNIENNYSGTTYTIPATVNYNNVDFAVTTIGANAFRMCSSLQSITIPASVTTMGTYAFYECFSLISVTFEGNACQDAIGEKAFYNVGTADNPATLVLPDNWTGSKPDQDGKWYDGYFKLGAPTALPTLFGDGVKGNKFMHKGQLIIRSGNKKYNALGQEL